MFSRQPQEIHPTAIQHLQVGSSVHLHPVRHRQHDRLSGRGHSWGTHTSAQCLPSQFPLTVLRHPWNTVTSVFLVCAGWWNHGGQPGVWNQPDRGSLHGQHGCRRHPGIGLPVHCLRRRGAGLRQHGEAGSGVPATLLSLPEQVEWTRSTCPEPVVCARARTWEWD